MKYGRKIIGVLLVLVSIAALITWEKWGKNQFLYDELLVLAENTPKGTVITEEMLKEVRMETREDDAIKASEKGKIIGREAAFFLHKGVPLFSQYVEQKGLTAGSSADRYVMAIPEGWRISCPESIAKGDRVYIFVRGKFVTSALVKSASAEEKLLEIIVTDKQAETLSKIAVRGDGLVMVYN